MKSAGKARNNGLYRHIRTSKEIIRNLLNYSDNIKIRSFLPIFLNEYIGNLREFQNLKAWLDIIPHRVEGIFL